MRITEKTLAFLDENAHRNDRDWFVAHKEQYREFVETSMLALSGALGPAILAIDPGLDVEPRRTLSRIRRDTRFARDKSLFRRSMWLAFRREKGLSHPVFFFELCPEWHRYGCGYYATPPRVMDCIRQHILNDDPAFERARAALTGLPQFVLDGEMYKRLKYADQPPELRAWLERKSVTVVHTSTDRSQLFAANLPALVADSFTRLAPVYRFLVSCHAEAMHDNESQRTPAWQAFTSPNE